MRPSNSTNRRSIERKPVPSRFTIAESSRATPPEPSSTGAQSPQHHASRPSEPNLRQAPFAVVPIQNSASNPASASSPQQVVILANPADTGDSGEPSQAPSQPDSSKSSSSKSRFGPLTRLLHPKRSRKTNDTEAAREPSPPPAPQQSSLQRPSLRAQGRGPSIGLRRFDQQVPPGTYAAVPVDNAGHAVLGPASPGEGHAGRRRSMSDPERGNVLPGSTTIRPVRTSVPTAGGMPSLQEEPSRGQVQPVLAQVRRRPVPTADDDVMSQSDVMDFDNGAVHVVPATNEYHADWVDVLDTIDPEVSTLNTLTNVQNSLFIPNLGRFLPRRAVYNLTPMSTRPSTATGPPHPPEPTIKEEPKDEEPDMQEGRPPLTHTSTITSTLSESRYAVLPHGKSLAGWSKEDKAELNDHVRHMLHSRRSKMKRRLKGFGQYVRKPLGFLVTLYATLITLFGLAWVLFLIGWINVGGKQLYVINIIDYILVALFAIMGDGLAPFRAWDTYNMIYIVHYHRRTWKLRKKHALPKLENKNDLPEQKEEEVGLAETKQGDFVVLTDKQQASLTKHQGRFERSHTFYKPHETETHFAFPIAYLIAVVVLLDCHSMFQIALGACTWGIDYHHRPFALTTVILICSISCNVTAAILISVGDHKTRKKDVVERMDRQELTSEAMEKIQRDKEKEKEREEKEAERARKEAAGETTADRVLDTISGSLGPKMRKAPSTGSGKSNLSNMLRVTSKSSDQSRAKSPGEKSTPALDVPHEGSEAELGDATTYEPSGNKSPERTARDEQDAPRRRR